jgi:serpin B
MRLAFDEAAADFSGIARSLDPAQRLSISAVFHKAFVKVDEKGTEAAAATAVVMLERGPAPDLEELKIDHPFLFFIVDKLSGLILFMGRVVDPVG